MAFYSGFVNNSGGQTANRNFITFLKDTLTTEGWTIKRYVTSGSIWELIASSTGYSTTEQIYIGFRSYENVSSDYYNITVASFTGYVSGNTFDTQPGYAENGVCGHNLRMDYWVSVSPQRVAMALKVGTPVYETAYVGKFFPYATPSQYSYPVVCIGTLTGMAATRFSDTSHTMGFRGSRSNALLRDVSGAWIQPSTWPWNADAICSTSTGGGTHQGQQRDTGAVYSLNPIVTMKINTEVYGELEGVYHITGFNNVVENTLTIGSRTFVVIQDVGRNGFNDYIALETT